MGEEEEERLLLSFGAAPLESLGEKGGARGGPADDVVSGPAKAG